MEKITDLKYTPISDEHAKLNAKMASFAGWYMPIQYEGIIAEHNHTRTAASLFDICHMGEFYVKGGAVDAGLENMFSFSVKDMPVGKCRYGAMLNDKGGIIDDLVVYRLSENEWMIVVNAGTIEKDAAHIKTLLKKGTRFENRSAATAKLDLQGPLSRDILAKAINPDIAKLKYYTFNYFDILGEKNIISRTGYTGELGYELYINSGKAVELWHLLLKDKRLKPAGLGARDTLRLEMGYTLYGQDVDEHTTPLEAGLERFIDFDRDFMGKSALVSQRKSGVKKLLIAFQSDSRKSPRHGYSIHSTVPNFDFQGGVKAPLSIDPEQTPIILPCEAKRRGCVEGSITKDGKEIGAVTSGSFSPSLGVGIGLGYIEAACAKTGKTILIKSGAAEINAAVVDKPFYKKGTARS